MVSKQSQTISTVLHCNMRKERIDALSSSSPKIEKYFNIYSPSWCPKPILVFTFIKNKRCFEKCPGCSFPYNQEVDGDGICPYWHYIVALCEIYLQLLVIPFVSPASHIASNLLISPEYKCIPHFGHDFKVAWKKAQCYPILSQASVLAIEIF